MIELCRIDSVLVSAKMKDEEKKFMIFECKNWKIVNGEKKTWESVNKFKSFAWFVWKINLNASVSSLIRLQLKIINNNQNDQYLNAN